MQNFLQSLVSFALKSTRLCRFFCKVGSAAPFSVEISTRLCRICWRCPYQRGQCWQIFRGPPGACTDETTAPPSTEGGDAVRFVAPPLRKVQQKFLIFAAGPLLRHRGGFDLKILGLESRKVLRSKPHRGLKGFDSIRPLQGHSTWPPVAVSMYARVFLFGGGWA